MAYRITYIAGISSKVKIVDPTSPNPKWGTPNPKPKRKMGKRERERRDNEERGKSPKPHSYL